MFNITSKGRTPYGEVHFLQPMTATCGEFVRRDELCKVTVIHTATGLLTSLLTSDSRSFSLNEHELNLVETFYKERQS